MSFYGSTESRRLGFRQLGRFSAAKFSYGSAKLTPSTLRSGRQVSGWRLDSMGKKKQASALSAFIDPPRPLAPLKDWIEYRRGLNWLESELRVSHPDLSWLDELQSLEAAADAAIKALIP
jgi:hypothetical protein